MLKEAMLAVEATDMEYAQEVADLLEAAYLDLTTAGVVINGEVKITITETVDQTTGETSYTATDNSTITDKMVIQAMKTYVRRGFRSPPDYDRLDASYDAQLKKLANTNGYTDFDDAAEGST